MDMIINPMFSSRNFSLKEISHRPIPMDSEALWLEACGYFQMGIMQMIRDLISKKFGVDVPITPTSGYRNPTINEATPGAAKNSLHMWRIAEGMQLYCACDFTVDGSKVDPKKVYEFLVEVLGGFGELIYYPKDHHFHYSASVKKEPFIQGG